MLSLTISPLFPLKLEDTINALIDFDNTLLTDLKMLPKLKIDSGIELYNLEFEEALKILNAQSGTLAFVRQISAKHIADSKLSIIDWMEMQSVEKIILANKVYKKNELAYLKLSKSDQLGFILQSFSLPINIEDQKFIVEYYKNQVSSDQYSYQLVIVDKNQVSTTKQYYFTDNYIANQQINNKDLIKEVMLANKTQTNLKNLPLNDLHNIVKKYFETSASNTEMILKTLLDFDLGKLSLNSEIYNLSDQEYLLLSLVKVRLLELDGVDLIIEDADLIFDDYQKLINQVNSSLVNFKVSYKKSNYARNISISKGDKKQALNIKPSLLANFLKIELNIAKLFANCFEARKNAYSKEDFMPRKSKLKCNFCKGKGVVKVKDMSSPIFYPFYDIQTCLECQGLGLSKEIKQVNFQGMNIFDFYSCNISELNQFDLDKKINNIFNKLLDLKLNYLNLAMNIEKMDLYTKMRLQAVYDT